MLELVKFELEKIFKNKLIYIVALVIAIFMLGYPVNKYIEFKKDFSSGAEFEGIIHKYIKNNSFEEILKLREIAEKKEANGEVLTKEEIVLAKYFNTIEGRNINYKEERTNEINYELSLLEMKGENNSKEYEKLKKEKELLSTLKESNLFYSGDWNMLSDNVHGTMKIILLIIGLSGIFATEYSTKVAYLNLSSKKGKNILNKAKLISTIIYGTIVFLFVSLIHHLGTLTLGLPNGEVGMNNLFNVPYNITLNEFYIGNLIFSYLGTIIFALIIMILSLITKNIIIAFGLPLAIFFLPSQLIAFNIKSTINFSDLVYGDEIFRNYNSFNILGRVETLPMIMFIFAMISIITFLVIYFKYSKKQVVE